MAHHDNGEDIGVLLSTPATTHRTKIRRIVTIGCIVNAVLMCVKLTTGYLGHSDALVADGFHSLNDFAADMIMLLFIGISFKKADGKYSYGYGKYETFSTFLISLFLFFVAFHISKEAVESIIEYKNGVVLPQPDIWTVVIVILSMCSKEFLFRYYRKGSRDTGTMALLTNAWHHRSDALASVATLIGVSFSHFLGESWRILDPSASLILVIFIVLAAIRMIKPAFLELMDHSCPINITEECKGIVENTHGVKRLMGIKSRKNGHFLIFDIVIGVSPALTVGEAEIIAGRIRESLEKRFGINLMISVRTESIKD
ncbi:MAG: cation diffusion facilitator family transporter [Muribaculaceae bacterium]|nr:cation diffusion facilitator family transporter [Muribaculaceae bacterium]